MFHKYFSKIAYELKNLQIFKCSMKTTGLLLDKFSYVIQKGLHSKKENLPKRTNLEFEKSYHHEWLRYLDTFLL